MTDKPEIDFPEGPPPAELEITDLAVGDGAEAHPAARPSCTTSASRTPAARSSTRPGTAASLRVPARCRQRHRRLGPRRRRDEGRRPPPAGIPPDLGYGDRGAGSVIGPGETLIFVVDLLDVR